MIITINDSEYNKLYEAGNLDREAIIDTIVKAGGTEKVKIKVDYRQNNPCDITINNEDIETLNTLTFLKEIYQDFPNIFVFNRLRHLSRQSERTHQRWKM